MKKILLFFFLFTFSQSNIFSQDLISSEYLTSVSKATLEAQYPLDFKNGVDLYKMLYTTLDIQGQLDTASGLMVVPDDADFVYPMLCYQHGTVGSRWEVPSSLDGGYQLAVLFGGLGYATAAPDYLGLGEARGLHPYVHADSEGSVAADMLLAARQFANENDFLHVNDQLFITGYSQGGHAALAAHKTIQEDYADQFTVTASAPMSGPYSVSEKMIEFTLGDEEYLFVAYIAWTALSYNLAYDNIYDDLGDFFKAEYVGPIQQFANEEITLWELNETLGTLLYQNNSGQIKPKFMLQPEVLDAIHNDPTHPVSVALQDNDLVDWLPNAPVRLLYCTADDQVYSENAVYAAETMTANGAIDLLALDVNPVADHGGCVSPAVGFATLFFSGFQEITMVTNNKTPTSPDALLTISPNPAVDVLTVQLSDFADASATYQIKLYQLNGQLIAQDEISGNETLRVFINDWVPGVYLLQTVGENVVYSQKVVVE